MIKTRSWFLAFLCVSLFLGNYPLYSAPPYPLAIACVTNISFIGNGVTVDSFDSSDPNYSDWNASLGYGTYDVTKNKANGNVATCSTVINAINLGSGSIYGQVDTGPGGTVGVGPNGYVGPLPQGGAGVQNGYSNDDFNATFPDVVLPSDTVSWPAVPSSNIISSSGSYYISNITSSLTIDAPNITLYVAGSIALRGLQTITLTTNAANVAIYVAGPTISVTSGANINNLTQRASNLILYGLPSLTSITFAGNTEFTALIYAPGAAFLFSGGGNSTYDVVGAMVVRSALFSSHINVHFDEYSARNMPLWISSEPASRVIQAGSNVSFSISLGGGATPLGFQWYYNQTNLLSEATNSTLSLTNVQFSDAGAYSVVATNWSGSITSAPASLILYTNAAATLTAPLVITNSLKLAISGVTGLNYVIQSSSDLINWVSLTTNQPPFTFSDTNIPASPQKFYRAVCFPQ